MKNELKTKIKVKLGEKLNKSKQNKTKQKKSKQKVSGLCSLRGDCVPLNQFIMPLEAQRGEASPCLVPKGIARTRGVG